MNFKEFGNSMKRDLEAYLRETNPDVVVKQINVEKLQGQSYAALSVVESGSVGVNINLEELYERMNSGGSYNSVFYAAADIAESQLAHMPEFDLSAIVNYEEAKKHLCVEVVETARNAEMLEHVPHVRVENLSMVHRLQLGKNENGATTVLVTNDLMKRMGVTPEQLHEDAMNSTQQVRPATIKSMAEILSEVMEIPEGVLGTDMEPPFYVLSNEDLLNGAAVMFYPNVMEQAAKNLGGDFYVLPSSVHEVLLYPDNGTMQLDELRDMVCIINEGEVAPEDQLTDSVYHYEVKSRTFELGENYEKRMAAKQFTQEERGSVLKELRDRKQDTDLKPKPVPHRTNAEPVL
ncbi:MAG: DUF5688 family protein [Lachnospiraceae bacterium]|nr:DUF5688 family protein [Lachnospiraceae bacterium]